MKGRLRKICSFTLTFMLLFGIFGFGAQDVNASVVKKIVKSYDVAVVFDNSGSMYNNTDAWCKAKYAMEVFAYMMNYDEKQTLKVYPMWEVDTGGKTSGSYKPFEINSPKEVDQIHDMYTLQRGETPFEPVREAYKDLKNSKADEKWLVVLTDGSFNKDNRGDAVAEGAVDPQKELEAMAKDGIKVEYLALGEEADAINANEAAGLYATKATNKSLNTDLINLCNTIFQRATLPKDCIKGNGKLNLDMSMRNIIVFAQGKDVKVKSLKGSKEVEKLESCDCKYSDKSTDGKYASVAKVDKSLSGQVVTFGSCKRGSYKLDMKNVSTDNLEIFYEPDVNIKVTLKDSTKNNAKPIELTNAEGFTTGDYTIDYALIDNQTDKDVSTSKLLGKVTYDGKLVYSNGEKKALKQGDPFKLKPDGEAFVDVSATYLENYVISTGASDKMKDAYTIKVTKKGAKIAMDLDVMQKGNWYQLKKHDEWEPIRANLKLNKKDMTDEQLEGVKLDCTFDGKKMAYRTEPVPGESAVDIYIGENEKGKYVEPEKGKYEITATASYSDKYHKSPKVQDKGKFKVKTLGYWMWLLGCILGILALLALILWYNFRKSFPRKAYFNNKMGRTPLKVKSKSINLSSNNYPGELICDGEKVTSHIGRKKKNAKFVAKNLTPDAAVQSFTIGFGNEFTKDGSGDFIDTFGNKLTPQTKFTIGDNTEIVWNKKGKTRKGTISINH